MRHHRHSSAGFPEVAITSIVTLLVLVVDELALLGGCLNFEHLVRAVAMGVLDRKNFAQVISILRSAGGLPESFQQFNCGFEQTLSKVGRVGEVLGP